MYIGFNLKKADEMIEKVVEEYNNLGIYTKDQWMPLKETLRKEWIGPDELDFEKKLVERICKLYVESYKLAKKCTETLASLSDQWVRFQRKNTIDGSTADNFDAGSISIWEKIKNWLTGATTLKYNDSIIDFVNDLKMDANVNRGLQNANSKANIQSALNDFVLTIKNRTKELFEAIEPNQAFFGEQSSSIKQYIEATGVAIAEVTTAVKDMNDALEVLASSSYTTASSDVSSAYSTAKSTVESSVEELGSSRWV